MNEKLDAILTAYEDLWREAAMGDWLHLGGSGTTGVFNAKQRGSCAVLIMKEYDNWASVELIDSIAVDWMCPECGTCQAFVGHVMRHLNDRHDWDWLTFATKFRDALRAGGVA